MENNEPATTPARCRVEVKLSNQERALIVQGAELTGEGVAAFVRSAAVRAARDVISERLKD